MAGNSGSNNFADRISSIGFAICVGIHEDWNSAFGTGIAKPKGIENNTIFVNIGLKNSAIRWATDAEIFQHILRFRIDVPAENRPTGSVTKIIMKCRLHGIAISGAVRCGIASEVRHWLKLPSERRPRVLRRAPVLRHP